MNTIDWNKLRFDRYKNIEYVLTIDDITYAPILVIRVSKDEFIEHKLTKIEIEDNFSRGVNLFENIVGSYFKEIRKRKLEKLDKI